MPRGSRHKSSKHSSKEYSDSEKDSSLKDRKSKDETSLRVSKESNSGEKRKAEAANGDYAEEYNSSSKRRKERAEDSVNDRWNGGGEERKGKEKEKWSDSRSKKREESEDVGKKSGGGKSGGRRETRDVVAGRDREREKKGKDAAVADDHRASKYPSHKTDSNAHNLLQSPDSDNQHDRRTRRKRDGSGDGDRHRDNVDLIGKQSISKEDSAKDVRSKDDKHKDERFRDKYQEDLDRENRHREDKQRDERARDRVNNRSDEKRLREEKDTVEIRQKKSITQDGDQDRDREYDIGRDGNWDREYYHRDRDRDRERDRGRDNLHERDRDWELDHERDKDRDRNNDYDRTYLDDRSARYRDSKGKKRSPDDFDDYDDAKHLGIRNNVDIEKKSSSKIEPDTDRGRSQTRQTHVDNISNSRRKLSPNSSSHGASDDYRSSKAVDSKYKDSPADQRPKATSLREVTAFSSERHSKYRSSEKPIKMDEGNMGELSVERSSSLKASPKGLADRSPSSSLERRYMNRNSVRRSLEVEESGRRSRDSMGARDLPSADDRSIREMPLDESLPSDTSFYNRSSQSNSALIPPSSFRGGVGSPSFAGSVEEDGRVNSGSRFKRSGDPMSGRGQGNAWRGAQNWSSPVPNGYIPFQHGPSHGGFQAMMPQFPSPPLFGVRPPMDINHSGIPYHMPDADRFSGHLRPLGWQNMMDGSGPAHMHGWDGSNGVFRDEAHFYGGNEWDQNRHPMNGRGWESGADLWKGQNGDLPSTPHNEDATLHASDDVAVEQTGQKSLKENNNNGVQREDIETKPAVTSTKEFSKISSETPDEKMVDLSKSSDDDIVNVSSAYLSKLDISEELASPELFKQGIGLLNKEEKTTDREDTDMLVNLKDGARVVAKGSTVWSSSPFPATNNSVFQRALNIYKKQTICVNGLPIVNGGIIDVILAYNLKDEVSADDVDKMESSIRRCNAEKDEATEVVPDIDEMAEAAPEINNKVEAAPDLDEMTEVVPITSPREKPGEIVLATEVDCEAGVDTPHELPDEAYSHNSPIAVQDNSQGKVDGILPETLDDSITNLDSVAQTVSVLPSMEQKADDGGEMKGNDSSTASSEERKNNGDALSDPLILKDGSPNACGSKMAESNECESVILSRIHDSPESTH